MKLEIEGLELEPGVSWSPPLLSDEHHPIGAGSGPNLLEQQSLGSGSELVLFPLSVPSYPRPASAPLPQRVTVLKQEAPERVLGMGQGGPSASQSSRPLPICNTYGHQ